MSKRNSDERLKAIAARKRPDPEPGRNGRWILVLLVAVVTVAAVGGWELFSRVPRSEMSAGSLQDELLGWYLGRQEALLTAPSADSSPVTFEVTEGELLPSIADRLQASGLIRDGAAFRMLARSRGLDRSIQAGAHVLRHDMTAAEVLDELQVSMGDQVTITIPEGLRAEEVASLLAAQELVDRDEFLAAVAAGDAGSRAAVADRPAGTGLEGYLFPDTYAFEPNAGALAVLGKLLDTFEARFDPTIRALAAEGELTTFELVTLASIVEREAVLDEERGPIARVYHNRLETPPFLLNADPTVQYGLGFQPEDDTWWKRPLLTVDLAVDSPYNSYTTPGLPPGPIASPGLASLRAAADAPPGDWQYFVANDVACDGTHVFAVTYDEHLANVTAYQTGQCGR